ncbi:hypothetical protein J2Z31_001773 [Sinorhizobium kostiense]|uniref:Uncharacterized protein n=1 Tax=Sinorhizobium kostiense TaxID=76747 RepID=A0ABS4QXA5_9HYPH|nr:hypothetical protein [Sinorhizobium kostiense]MBP2235281.1 hypothetical protein [Sinorhizobium kostiense]
MPTAEKFTLDLPDLKSVTSFIATQRTDELRHQRDEDDVFPEAATSVRAIYASLVTALRTLSREQIPFLELREPEAVFWCPA